MAVMYNVLVRYNHTLRRSGGPGCVLQEKGMDWIIDYAPPCGALQSIGGEPVNAERGEGVLRVSMVTGLTIATWC